MCGDQRSSWILLCISNEMRWQGTKKISTICDILYNRDSENCIGRLLVDVLIPRIFLQRLTTNYTFYNNNIGIHIQSWNPTYASTYICTYITCTYSPQNGSFPDFMVHTKRINAPYVLCSVYYLQREPIFLVLLLGGNLKIKYLGNLYCKDTKSYIQFICI